MLLRTIVSIGFFAIVVFTGSVQAARINQVAAVVNGEMITLHDLNIAAGPELAARNINSNVALNDPVGKQVMHGILDKLVLDILITQEAERLKMSAGPDEVENELRLLIQRSQLTPQAFEEQALRQNLTMDEIREKIRRQIVTQRLMSLMITRKVVIPEKDMREYYEANQSKFITDYSINLSLMLFASTEKNIEKILADVRAGKMTFTAMVEKYSVGPNKDGGGNLGIIPWAELSGQWREALSSVAVGSFTGPIPTSDGTIAVLKINDKTDGRAVSFNEARPEIERILQEPKLMERFSEYTQQLRDKAVVDIKI